MLVSSWSFKASVECGCQIQSCDLSSIHLYAESLTLFLPNVIIPAALSEITGSLIKIAFSTQFKIVADSQRCQARPGELATLSVLQGSNLQPRITADI